MISRELYATVAVHLYCDPEDYIGLTRDEIEEALRQYLIELHPSVEFDDDDICSIVDDICDALTGE